MRKAMSASEARKLREEVGLSRPEWAAELEVDLSTVCRYENGNRAVDRPMAKLMRLVAAKRLETVTLATR